jgi:hypothetical protein
MYAPLAHVYDTDPTGLEKDSVCKQWNTDARTWEPEDFWEYVWLATLLDDMSK